jgi:hypothetical protein
LIAAASYEALPLDLSKAVDLSKIIAGDQAPRVAAVQLLPNPMLSTG